SCNEIPVVIGDVSLPDTDRVVLLEELTGASCPNCPKGTAAVEAILDNYPDKVAAIAIHGDFLSDPIKGRSKYDFRNPKAKDLENWFKPFLGKPCATVNRIDLNDPDQRYATAVTGKWQSMVETELNKPHQVSLLMETNYNPSNRALEIDITVIPIADINGSFSISVFLTESHIIDAQINGSNILDDFEHNHVLRDMPTKFDGDLLGTDFKRGQSFKKKYIYTLPDSGDGLWKPENMEVVAAVHKSGANDREVLQAINKKILE
ncbi:MAG: Omp28-related outer membrane protein, partial [Chitinophagales bacterium]|nr:Omp28-related outer membrane protein [Chitinophagales bacterium]